MFKRTFLLSTSVALSLAAFAQNKNIGINVSYMDKTADPKNNFFQYACGNWLKTAQIPASESSYGSFNEIRDRNNDNLKNILTEISADKTAKQGTNRQKIRDFYNQAMDTVKLDKEGIKPLAADMASIDKIASKSDLIKLLAHFHTKGIGAAFNFTIETDLRNSNANISYFAQGGTGLPDRDYYFEARYEKIKNEYKQHISNTFQLLGLKVEVADKAAETVMKVESELAKESMNRVELRKIEAQYNKFTKADFAKKTPNINWDLYFLNAGLKTVPAEFVVNQPKFYDKLNEMMQSISLAEWKTYLKWSLIHNASPYISSKFVKENFNFYGTVLSGAKVMKPRWKKALQATDASLGEALGQLYVEKYFSGDAKKRVNELVDNLIASYKQRITTRDWMSEETKKQALEKLNKIYRKLAFPDYWKDYSTLDIKADAYILNIYRANKFEYNEMIDRLGKPVDKAKWGMTPPTVNAYYNPTTNEIAFPAGIMQMPFFDPNADDAANYGCMGAIIGHELTHGFDDQGAQFDSEGNLKNWWNKADSLKFVEKTKILVDQFNSYVAIDSLHVNGELTLGENIADLGGLTMSYYAYKMSLNGKKSEVIDGLTGEQRFFIAWAQGWKVLMRPQALKQLVATNPHAPGNFRAVGPLTNMTEFYDAFNVKEGDAMYRKKEIRADIW